jgi:RimJ/RimL family protein N-acetyltransferase
MLEIVPATMNDAEPLFDWRNDPFTRAMSRNQDPVTWDSHVAWLTRRLSQASPHLYMALLDVRRIGTFRVDADEISYTVAPEHRGKGLGVAMLRKAREMFGPLRAEIFVRNVPSIKIAERSGMIVHLIDPPDAQRPASEPG